MAAATTKEIGSTGLSTAAGGVVTEELNPKLSGRQALLTYRSMKDNDALVGAILFAIDMLVRQVDWRVDKKDAKQKDADFLEECMDDMSMSWGDFISEIMSMLAFGFSFHEICYKTRSGPQPPGSKTPTSKYNDGKTGWRKLPMRAQETLDHWEFDDEGGVATFVQRAAPKYQDVPIPMEKGLLFRTTSYKNNPEGRSLLRNAYISWFYKKRIQTIEGTGIERDLAGFPVMWLPAEYLSPDATPEQKQIVASFENVAKNMRRDKQEYLIMPNAYDENGHRAFDIDLLSSGGSRTFDTSAIIQRYNQEIAMTVLADFILLGHEKVGSFALSSDKTDLFAVALGTILDSIADVMNRYAVPRLFALNGMKLDKLPEIAHGDIETPDLTELGAYITALSGAGMPIFPDEDLEKYLREAAGLPEKSKEAKDAQAANQNQPPVPGAPNPANDQQQQQPDQQGGNAASGAGAGNQQGTGGGPDGGAGKQPAANTAGIDLSGL